MTATLPLGDTGVGKSTSRSLFLSTVPGQVQKSSLGQDHDQSPSAPDIAALSLQDGNNGEAEQQDANDQQGPGAAVNGQEQSNEFLAKDAVSTLEIPTWLLVSAKGKSADSQVADGIVPAENIVVHDFVGYGQSLDACQTIDRVDNFLTEQYVATRNLFGASVTPLSTTTRAGPPSAEQQQPQPFLEQLLVDSPMAHSLPDACLYFVLYDLKPVDIVFMKRIMHKVNLIPILAKADTLSINQLWKAKSRILKQLEDNEIEFFRFGFTSAELKEMAAEKMDGGPPFALSTAELEIQRAGPPPASLTHLAVAINEGGFAESHSDLRLLQTLLLGSKNFLLHQAAVRKFMNRWRTDLGLPLEVTPSPSSPEEQDPSQQQEQHQQEGGEEAEQNGNEHAPESNGDQVQGTAQEQGQEYHQEQEQQEQQQQQAPLQQPNPIQQQYYHQQPAQQQQLPPALQQQAYQPSSSYTAFASRSQTNLLKGSTAAGLPQDDEVAQVFKLSRAQSVIRSASPKIYSQGNVIPAVPPLNNSSSPTSPSTTPPLATTFGVILSASSE
ncbi:Septin 4 [Dissophora ornata]|nr:Septin 4 [Dissophora ornata]